MSLIVSAQHPTPVANAGRWLLAASCSPPHAALGPYRLLASQPDPHATPELLVSTPSRKSPPRSCHGSAADSPHPLRACSAPASSLSPPSVLGALMALAMTVAEFQFLADTSAVTVSVAGVCKEVLTIMVSALLYGDHLGALNLLGALRCALYPQASPAHRRSAKVAARLCAF